MHDPTPNARNRLQSERQRRGWQRKYVAEQLGVSEYTIGQWERGKHIPYPVHIQKLCNLFDTSAEALGLTTNAEASGLSEAPSEINTGQGNTTNLSSHIKRQRSLIAIAGIALVLVLVLAAGVSKYILFPALIKPGGVWVSPTGSTIGDMMHFAAYAYPTNPGDPAIDHVNFTMYWPGVDPRTWKIACTIYVPVGEDLYVCDVNLRHLGAVPGQIVISFDVYDRQGHVNFAPNGEHHLIYVPS